MSKLYYNSNESKSLQQKLKVAAHDVNNLLSNVLNGLELLKENSLNSESIEIFNHIEKNTLLASQIIHQISYGNFTEPIISENINLIDIINESFELLGDNSNIQFNLEFNCSKDEFVILGNYTEIKRVFLNLFINAKEASDNKLIINVFVEKFKNDLLKVSIADNGKGISADVLHKIFHDNFSTKSKQKQRGLGLSIVKSIMESHSGKIIVSSKENEGTIFDLYFPLNYKTKKKIDYSDKRVLIAEDDDFQREVLKELLSSMKFNVFTASNGIEALDVLISANPDLLFIDDNMPGMSGVECSEKIRENNNFLPIVLVTGSSFEKNLLPNQISKVLRKPYTFEMVLSTLDELL